MNLNVFENAFQKYGFQIPFSQIERKDTRNQHGDNGTADLKKYIEIIALAWLFLTSSSNMFHITDQTI